ncbi:MAG: tRNA 2-thiouridine(34) synthase MnmA [Planctomycetia bacterium]|nr:tRNA 2-thiouridine(34) synthase MnmA [Planctomycetia bacterium]
MNGSNNDGSDTRVAIALSGGVDSSVAAALLIQQGYDVSAFFMRHRRQATLSPEESLDRWNQAAAKINVYYCRKEADGTFSQTHSLPDNFAIPREAADAIAVAAFLKIDFTLFDAGKPFETIVDHFVEQYYAGQTPNPCALCNPLLKFGLLVDAAFAFDSTRFATGHYVRTTPHSLWLNQQCQDFPDEVIPDWLTDQNADSIAMTRGHIAKDQSYVLYGIDRRRLPQLLFPLGTQTKEETQAMAASLNLPTANKHESQDICFVEDGKHVEFLKSRAGGRQTQGNFVSLDGKILAPHAGYERYTIGQRKGLGVGFGERIFVQQVDPVTHNVVLGPYESLARTEINAVDSRWLLDVPIGQPFRCEIKIRYRNPSQPGQITIDASGNIVALLDAPRYGVAPGQALVCYWKNRLLGGGRIV